MIGFSSRQQIPGIRSRVRSADRWMPSPRACSVLFVRLPDNRPRRSRPVLFFRRPIPYRRWSPGQYADYLSCDLGSKDRQANMVFNFLAAADRNMRGILICSKPDYSFEGLPFSILPGCGASPSAFGSPTALVSASLQWSIRIADEIANWSHLCILNAVNKREGAVCTFASATRSPIATSAPMP